jgi:hypothetical protein
MAEREFSIEELRAIRHAIARLRADVMAVVFGLIGGASLFAVTIWLVLRGPAPGQQRVGTHLGLLSNYFPGYEVTVSGSLIGLFYGALVGALLGWTIAFIYNMVADKRRAFRE